MPPTVLFIITQSPNQQNKTSVYSIIPCCSIQAIACWTLCFLKVKWDIAVPLWGRSKQKTHRCSHSSPITSDYERFNCNNFNIRYWAGITAAAGTRLALQSLLVKDLNCTHSNCEGLRPTLLFTVTTSPCRHWVICAPAALLGCGSHFSGSLRNRTLIPRYP